ncbi:MAG: glycosyltransferase [Phycisphaerales bacterium]
MTHLLCIINGLTGIMNATCALGRRLERRGHRVTIASPMDVGERIREHGFDFRQLDGPPPGWSPAQRRADPAQALGVHELAATLSDIAPDAVLVDLELHPHIMVSRHAGYPTGLVSPFLNVFKSPGIPPLHHAVLPAGDGRATSTEQAEAAPADPSTRGSSQRALDWHWARFLAWKRGHRWRRQLRSRSSDKPSLTAALARGLGVDIDAWFDRRAWLIPYVARDLPLLYLMPRELDFPHAPPARVAHAGPMVDLDRPEPALDAADRRRLDDILDGRRAGTDTAAEARPLILVSMSTVASGDRTFLRHVVAMAAAEPNWDVVMALGGKADPASLGERPANLHAFGWLPQMEVLPFARAAITTAGANTMVECALHGVPTRVFSLDRNDQNGNAARTRFHGIGIASDLASATAEGLRQDVQRVLTDEAYARRAAAMRDALLAYDARDAAALAVEAMFKLTAPRP